MDVENLHADQKHSGDEDLESPDRVEVSEGHVFCSFRSFNIGHILPGFIEQMNGDLKDRCLDWTVLNAVSDLIVRRKNHWYEILMFNTHTKLRDLDVSDYCCTSELMCELKVNDTAEPLSIWWCGIKLDLSKMVKRPVIRVVAVALSDELAINTEEGVVVGDRCFFIKRAV